jgi:hypothetical protein
MPRQLAPTTYALLDAGTRYATIIGSTSSGPRPPAAVLHVSGLSPWLHGSLDPGAGCTRVAVPLRTLAALGLVEDPRIADVWAGPPGSPEDPAPWVQPWRHDRWQLDADERRRLACLAQRARAACSSASATNSSLVPAVPADGDRCCRWFAVGLQAGQEGCGVRILGGSPDCVSVGRHCSKRSRLWRIEGATLAG